MSENGIPWGEDLERDCRELRRLESWGLYREGHHDLNCPLDHSAPTDRGHATLDLCLASATIGLACLALIEPRLLLVVAVCLVAWLVVSVPLALGVGRMLARGGEEG